MDINSKVFGERLKSVYKLRGKTQEWLAKSLKVSRQTIGKYVAGDHYPTVEMLIEISKTLDVSTDYLLGLSDIMKNSKQGVFDSYLKASPYSNSDLQNAQELLGLSTQSIKKIEAWQRVKLDGKKLYAGRFNNLDALNMLITGIYSDELLKSIGTLLTETENLHYNLESSKYAKKIKDKNINVIGDKPPIGYTEKDISEMKEKIHFYIWKATERFRKLLAANVAHYAQGEEYDKYSNSHITIF